jgi:hypothetical protein
MQTSDLLLPSSLVSFPLSFEPLSIPVPLLPRPAELWPPQLAQRLSPRWSTCARAGPILAPHMPLVNPKPTPPLLLLASRRPPLLCDVAQRACAPERSPLLLHGANHQVHVRYSSILPSLQCLHPFRSSSILITIFPSPNLVHSRAKRRARADFPSAILLLLIPTLDQNAGPFAETLGPSTWA